VDPRQLGSRAVIDREDLVLATERQAREEPE
jgi:hypothetical protein